MKIWIKSFIHSLRIGLFYDTHEKKMARMDELQAQSLWLMKNASNDNAIALLNEFERGHAKSVAMCAISMSKEGLEDKGVREFLDACYRDFTMMTMAELSYGCILMEHKNPLEIPTVNAQTAEQILQELDSAELTTH